MINKLFLAISLVSLLLYLYGILTSIINVEENSCKMTYMFEYPQFVVSMNLRDNLFVFLITFITYITVRDSCKFFTNVLI